MYAAAPRTIASPMIDRTNHSVSRLIFVACISGNSDSLIWIKVPSRSDALAPSQKPGRGCVCRRWRWLDSGQSERLSATRAGPANDDDHLRVMNRVHHEVAACDCDAPYVSAGKLAAQAVADPVNERSPMNQPTLLTGAVVEVGHGRGFIVGATDDTRYVVTAAHCLPRWRYPRPHLDLGSAAALELAAMNALVVAYASGWRPAAAEGLMSWAPGSVRKPWQ